MKNDILSHSPSENEGKNRQIKVQNTEKNQKVDKKYNVDIIKSKVMVVKGRSKSVQLKNTSSKLDIKYSYPKFREL